MGSLTPFFFTLTNHNLIMRYIASYCNESQLPLFVFLIVKKALKLLDSCYNIDHTLLEDDHGMG